MGDLPAWPGGFAMAAILARCASVLPKAALRERAEAPGAAQKIRRASSRATAPKKRPGCCISLCPVCLTSSETISRERTLALDRLALA
jgi:hypothetical protein